MSRISADTLYINIANELAKRATCLRGSHGCVVVSDFGAGVIIGTGYNGAPRGLPHCTDAGCLMEDGHCVRTIHAEINALLNTHDTFQYAPVLYVTSRPCVRCSVAICQSRVGRVVWDARNQLYSTDYQLNNEVLDMFRQAGVLLSEYVG